jgi:hypothetical protein
MGFGAGCRWLVENKGFNKSEPNKVLDFFIFGVTIIVVAVPEGLPLAVTISLAYRFAPCITHSKPHPLIRKAAGSPAKAVQSHIATSAYFLNVRSQSWEVAL